MSRAFTTDGQESESQSVLPERPVSAERNLVTERGLAAIEAQLHDARSVFARAEAGGDRIGMANAARDIRYWSARRVSAELSVPADSDDVVRFGMAVTLRYEDGAQKVWRIVGEDEADVAKGRISHVAPLARALFGKDVGDELRAGPHRVEIVAIDPVPEPV